MNYAEATNEDTLDLVTYCAGKAMAECAARDFTATEGPSFDLVNIYPPCVYGPIKNGILSNFIPPTSVWICVDIRDVAEAHLKIFEVPRPVDSDFWSRKAVSVPSRWPIFFKKGVAEMRTVGTS
ncbi:hypothetical protein ETB97_001217 [Aspergillus alliaceus]|uniref:Uncharacterized protein n=1 Tax=Petromyces alliaceus TaxID=209559 RepID=A0A8H6A526_PETAA|nr:hypothetical protein ETB97_001217 [Aspergillus burnettii]